MPRAKPLYKGSTPKPISALSSAIKRMLQDCCPDQEQAEDFAEQILAAARRASGDLAYWELEINKQETRAELADLLQILETVSKKLRSLSLVVERILPLDAHPLETADSLDELAGHVRAAANNIEKLPKKLRPDEVQHYVAVEMTIEILRILQQYGISTAATADSDFDYQSDAVKILRPIGQELGLVFAKTTWRDIIIEAKKSVDDFQ